MFESVKDVPLRHHPKKAALLLQGLQVVQEAAQRDASLAEDMIQGPGADILLRNMYSAINLSKNRPKQPQTSPFQHRPLSITFTMTPSQQCMSQPPQCPHRHTTDELLRC